MGYSTKTGFTGRAIPTLQAGLVNYAGQVMKQRPDEYKAESAACQAAGAPIIHKANEDITQAQLAAVEQTPQSPEKVAVGAAA